MSNLIKALSTIIIILTLIFNNLNFSFNLNIQAKTNNQTISKKSLKNKLLLGYTNPKFETDLDSNQKQAILKSLKKWKGELPIDNSFTITSIANLKSETTDQAKQHKKLNKNTSNALVVYMWSQTTNPNYDPKNPGDGEEGDPSMIRTPFNVLLKQTKNGNWIASLERDPEAKADTVDITETDQDAQIYKDLFITDNPDNGYTATEEVLVEDGNTLPAAISSSIPISSLSKIEPDRTSTISSSSVTVQDIPKVVPEQNESVAISKEKTSWIQSILNFGSVSVSAQVAQQYNYSWPWKGGDTWAVGQGWHGCETYTTADGFIGSPSGCALDIQPINSLGVSMSNNLVAPITTSITRSCDDGFQGMYKLGNMSILHIASGSMIINSNVLVRKGDNIGNAFNPNVFPYTDLHWKTDTVTQGKKFVSSCGETFGTHIHIKLASITNPANTLNTTPPSMQYESLTGSTTIDGKYLQGAKITPVRSDNKQNYNPILNQYGQFATGSTYLTSQNYPNTNTYTGKIKSFTNNNKIFDIYDFNGNNGAAVQLYEAGTNNPVNQRWYFDDVNRQVKGMNGKCLEVSSTNYIKMQDCTTTTSQKWQFNSNNQIISEANSMCIEAQSGITDGSLLIVNTCNTSNNNQKWNFADIVILSSGSTRINTRVNLAGPWNTTTKLMNKDLNTNNKIPLLQPFCNAPWNYCGTENIPDRVNIDQSAVDWVLIEIKNASGITVQRKAALITNDAFLTDANGINSPGNFYPVKFSNITSPGYYKIIVRHRNHLAIATDSNVYLTQSNSPSTYNNIDLTKNVNVKGANQQLLGAVNGVNVYGMRFGDVNSDGYIDSSDKNIVSNSIETANAYSKIDINMDTYVDATDRVLILNTQEAGENL